MSDITKADMKMMSAEQQALVMDLQAQIVRLEERLQITQSMAHIGDWRFDLKECTVSVSEEALKMIGIYHDDQKLEWSYGEFSELTGQNIEVVINQILSTQDEKNPKQFDKEYDFKVEGALKKIHIMANLEYSDNNEITRIYGTLQDRTERYQLEDALRQSEKLMAVGQLAGGIAHDFNNILMAASGYAELIQLKTDNKTIIKYSENILKSIKRSSDLTTKLLAFSRKDSAFKKGINVHKSVINVLEIISRTIPKNIMIECRLLADEDYIIGDSNEIQNVFLNLCLNARDAIKKGGSIRVRSENVMVQVGDDFFNKFDIKVGKYICFSVMDNGCGIPKENIKKIFDPFFTTKGIGKGTGLGLSAIYGTMVTHNGAITVESEVGAGTTFKLYFPIVTESFDI